jgi:hypothetical protein
MHFSPNHFAGSALDQMGADSGVVDRLDTQAAISQATLDMERH